jgi:hypothetical protein
MSPRLDKKNLGRIAAQITAINQAVQRSRATFANQFAPTSGDGKHSTAWVDYGYPADLTFQLSWSMFKRFGLAKAGIMRPVEASWRTNPTVSDVEELVPGKPTPWAVEFAKLSKRLQLWNRLRGVDYRQRVFRYAGLLMTVKDNQALDQPLTRQTSPDALESVKPLYESQLEVSSWEEDQTSARYGLPILYQLKESVVGDRSTETDRDVAVHWTRVITWAEGADDGTIYGTPALEAGFNDLITLEKIIGAGGEGFWKNARAALNMNIDPEAPLGQLAQSLGTDLEGLPDALDDLVKDFLSGLDKQLMLQGIEAKPLSVTLPDSEKPFKVALEDFAASLPIPVPILVGQQISQRSSDGNDGEWDDIIGSRREQFLSPAIELVVRRFMELGFLKSAEEVFVIWDDLTAPTAQDKLGLAEKMSVINKNTVGTGQAVPFSSEQIAEAAGFEMDAGQDDIDVPEGDEDGDE